MKVTLSRFLEAGSKVTATWECRVLAPALLWAVQALSTAKCAIEIADNPVRTLPVTGYPSFWPAGLKETPLDTEIPSHSDHPGLRSLKDEAVRCWEMSLTQMNDRGEWLKLLGAHPCMIRTLQLPFQLLVCKISYKGSRTVLRKMLGELTKGDQFPETRLLGFHLGNNKYLPAPNTVPDWVKELL